MINYEGMDYNLDTIIQFQALKKLLEALAKKQIDHNIMIYGYNNKNIIINNNEDNKTNEIENVNGKKGKENKNKKDDESQNESNENDNKSLSHKSEDEKIIKEIKDFGLMKMFIDSQKQLIEQTKLIDELNSRIEALEKGKTSIKKIINKGENTQFNLNNKEANSKENNNENEDDNNQIKDNIDKLDLNLNDDIKTNDIINNEMYFKQIREQLEKNQKETKINKLTIDSYISEISNLKNLINQIKEQIILSEQKRKKQIENEENESFAIFEKKILKVIDLKIKESSIKSENKFSNELNNEKEKIKEDNEKILSEIKSLEDKNNELDEKIKGLPIKEETNKMIEKIKLLEMELNELPTKNDIKPIYDEIDKIKVELSKFNSFFITQKEINVKFREDILKIKNAFDNIKRTFSSMTKLFENNSIAQLIDNLSDLSAKMVEKDEYNKYSKEINKILSEIKMDVNDHNRSLEQIMPMIQKILTMEDLKKLESSLVELIEKQNTLSSGKFADKKEIIKSIKSIQAQVKLFMENLDKEREKEKNEGCILASRPVPGYKCASCEAYIGDIKESTTYLPWNKIQGMKKPYRLGSSFSRILQGLNIDNTFNPFLQKNFLKSEDKKKYVLSSNDCLSVKKVRKIPPLMHMSSEYNLVKELTNDEPFNLDSNNLNNYNNRGPNYSNINPKFFPPKNPRQNNTLKNIAGLSDFANSQKRDLTDIKHLEDLIQNAIRLNANIANNKSNEISNYQMNDMIMVNKYKNDILSLSKDVTGNYAVQKVLNNKNIPEVNFIIESLKNNIYELTLNLYGCRCVQELISILNVENMNIITNELKPFYEKCILDKNGNHVIQKLIEKVSEEDLNEIYLVAVNNIIFFSKHQYGCRVIQRLFKYCNKDQIKFMLNNLFININDLIQDQYGNYVIQFILENQAINCEELYPIFYSLRGNIYQYSFHKFASNVVERCITFGNEIQKKEIINEVVELVKKDEELIINMVRDRFANYVVQKIIE